MSAATSSSSAAAAMTDSSPATAASKRKLDSSTGSSSAAGGGRWIHHTGEDTIDDTLEVYYCAYCGAHSLILDTLITSLPSRKSDSARVLTLSKHAAQLILDEGNCVKIKRTESLIEKQYRYLCKGCGLTLAYLSHPFADRGANKYLYLIDGALSLSNAGKTSDQLEMEEKEQRAVPIVIPKFTIKQQQEESDSSSSESKSTQPTTASSAASSTSDSASSLAAPTSAAATDASKNSDEPSSSSPNSKL